jgi:transposase
MSKVLLAACDDHCRTMVLRVGVDQEEPVTWRSGRSKMEREALMGRLRGEAQRRSAERIVLAYEASGQGFGWHDELRAAGMECYVLAPSKLKRSPKERKAKDDVKDAQLIYEALRGFVLAGNRLPKVWVPPPELRDDREVTRGAADVTRKIARVKVQVQALLRRHQVELPQEMEAWTKGFRARLAALAEGTTLGPGTRVGLRSLLRQLAALEQEEEELGGAVRELAGQPRYREGVAALDALKGVGPLLALMFLTEMGDLRRFNNRRKIGAYLGLVPTADESGEIGERKGHITKQGSARLRKLLCQAAWSRVRKDAYGDARERARYERQVARNPKRKKIALVACMRRLAVLMHHVARDGEEWGQGCGPKALLPRPQAPRLRGRPFARVALGVGPGAALAGGAGGTVGVQSGCQGQGAGGPISATDAEGDGAAGRKGKARSWRKRAGVTQS